MSSSLRIVTAAAVAAITLGSLPVLAEGGENPASQQRARLEAEWAKARARDAANPNASFVERLFGIGDRRVAEAPQPQPKKN